VTRLPRPIRLTALGLAAASPWWVDNSGGETGYESRSTGSGAFSTVTHDGRNSRATRPGYRGDNLQLPIRATESAEFGV